MKIFIDTPVLWNSGYETHIRNFLLNIDSIIENDELLLYGHNSLLSKIEKLSQKTTFIIDNEIPSNAYRAFRWRKNKLPSILNYYNPDAHFNLMGWMHHRNNNFVRVGMNRNLQPFIPEAVSYSPILSKDYFRLKLYKHSIIKSYNNCTGVIFNSGFAQQIIEPLLSPDLRNTVITHGVNEEYRIEPRKHNKTDVLQILYISDFYPYKNQENLIKAINMLREEHHLNLKLNLIGNINSEANKRIIKLLRYIPNQGDWLIFHKKVPHNQLIDHFIRNDIFVFASSVESFGHSLIEAMAAGMPIACSNRKPMTDFLGPEAITFNENSFEDIAQKILQLIKSPGLRQKIALDAFARSQNFSYKRMTKETLDFLRSF